MMPLPERGKPGSVFNWALVYVQDLYRFLMGADVPIKNGNLILGILLTHQNEEEGTLNVTSETLSKEVGVSERTLYRALDETEAFFDGSFRRILYPGPKEPQVRRQINIGWFGICKRLLPLQDHHPRKVIGWNHYWKVIERAVLETHLADFPPGLAQGKDCQNLSNQMPGSLFPGSPKV